MIPKDIAKIISISEGIKESVAKKIVDEIFSFIGGELSKHNKVWLPKVGFWWIKNRNVVNKYNVKKDRWYVWADRPMVIFNMSDLMRRKIKKKGKEE